MSSFKRGTGWLAAGVVLSAASCARDAVSPRLDRGGAVARQDVAATTDNVAIQWDNAALQAIRVAKLGPPIVARRGSPVAPRDRKSTRLNSSHRQISYAVFCL